MFIRGTDQGVVTLVESLQDPVKPGQLFRIRREFFFSSLLLRDVALEPKGADDVSVRISQRQL